MEIQAKSEVDRNILDEKLTELALLAKGLCPEAMIEVNTVGYEDEDGRVKVFPPPHLSETEEEALEEILTEKWLCAVPVVSPNGVGATYIFRSRIIMSP